MASRLRPATTGAALSLALPAVLVVAMSAGCDRGPEKLGPDEILVIEPHHETRIFITYRDKNEQTYRQTVHRSTKFKCGDIVIDPRDFLKSHADRMPYGAFDAAAYAEYKKRGQARKARGTELDP